MSDTPRTDERTCSAFTVQRAEGDGLPLCKEWVYVEFARELERELAAANEAAARTAVNSLMVLQEAERERDEAKEALADDFKRLSATITALRAENASLRAALRELGNGPGVGRWAKCRGGAELEICDRVDYARAALAKETET